MTRLLCVAAVAMSVACGSGSEPAPGPLPTGSGGNAAGGTRSTGVAGLASAGAPTTSGGSGSGGSSSGGSSSGGSSSGGSSVTVGGTAGTTATAGSAGTSSAGAATAGAGGTPSAGASGGGAPNAGAGGAGASDPGTDGDGDFTIGPTFTDSPDLAVRNVPHGVLYDFSMSSTMSAIYPGTDATLLLANQHAFTRAVRVYVPRQYVDGSEAPFMVVQDGYVDAIAKSLDNLIADPDVTRRLPAMVVVFVANGGGDSKGSERGLEYDTVSDRYSRFIDTEVLPAVTSLAAIKAVYPNFKLTNNPEGRGMFGCSSGGAAAFTAGWFAPNSFHRLITYSGTFVDQQDDDAAEEAMYPNGAWEYLQHLIPASAAKPLRVFLEAGQNDNDSTLPESSHHNWVLANQGMAAALKAKGYHYRFIFALGASHCDARVQRQTIPDTLRWMWRGYPANIAP